MEGLGNHRIGFFSIRSRGDCKGGTFPDDPHLAQVCAVLTTTGIGMINRLFVYGTLQPGQGLWPKLERFVIRSQPAKLPGFVLYELPEGYPAIEPGDGEVTGTLLELKPEHVERAIQTADRLEGFVEEEPGSLYRRVVVDVAGAPAYTYVYHPNRRGYLRAHGEFIASGDWLQAG